MAKIPVLGETELRDRLPTPTIAMLDRWHELCEERFGSSPEILVTNRKEVPALAAYQGEINTAWPDAGDSDRGCVLLVMLQISNENTFEEIVLSHEVGHWVLKLEGMRGIQYQPKPHQNIEILLNSMAQHPALYALQRALGDDPQPEIDRRATFDIKLAAESPNPQPRLHRQQAALLYADDIMNCSSDLADELMRTIKSNAPNVMRPLEAILGRADHYDLLDPGGNRKFVRRVAQDFKLGARWIFIDERDSLRKIIEEHPPIWKRQGEAG